VAGGLPGAPSENAFVDAGGEHALPTMPMHTYRARRDDVFRVVSAGGGGFGDPFARDPERVLADVREEKVTLAAAREQYGVVIDRATLTVDQETTCRLRERRS
jgi:N-methylhydantoinase B